MFLLVSLAGGWLMCCSAISVISVGFCGMPDAGGSAVVILFLLNLLVVLICCVCCSAVDLMMVLNL